MSEREIIILNRDCIAYMVPSGARIMLHDGTEVTVQQALGGSYTVNVYGNLARIEGEEVAALGKEPFDVLANIKEGATLDEKIEVVLKQVFDPEIPVNIVDLGLIYTVDTRDLGGSQQFAVDITMTLTAPGCGMGPVIAEDVKRLLLQVEEITEVNAEFVFDPPWDRSMMSEAAKLELGVF